MKRSDLIDTLRRFEEEYPVYRWRCDGFDLWPLIKREIFFEWYNKQQASRNIKVQKDGVFSTVIKLMSSIVNIFLFKMLKRRLDIEEVYVGSADHRTDWETNFVNRYFYPRIVKQASTSYLQIEYGADRKGKRYLNKDEIIFVERYKIGFVYLNKLKKQQPFSLPRWDEFLIEVEDRLNISPIWLNNSLKRKLIDIRAYFEVFKMIFHTYKPNRVFGLCYYNTSMFALHRFCNEDKITNYDVQHGGQGPLHPMYSYSNFPATGLNILPQVFWCWDKNSAENIRSWIQQNAKHQVALLGHPWLEYLTSHQIDYKLPKSDIILYTIQENHLDDFILDAISLTPDSFEWWIRLHPRMPDAKSTILSQLKVRNIVKHVEFDLASSLPLPHLLSSASVHISKFSGSIIEGILVKTPTIIIDEVGVEFYKNYLQTGEAIASLHRNGQILVELIQQVVRTNQS